jgi:hypothetical protein
MPAVAWRVCGRAQAAGWARWRGLVSATRTLFDRRAGARAGRLLARSIGLGYGGAMLVVAFAGARDVVQNVTLVALGVLTWAGGGLVALSAARPAAGAEAALSHLAALAGHRPGALAAARTVAAAGSVTSAIGWPAALLALLALTLAGSFSAAFERLLLLLGVIGYSLVAGASLGLLACWSAVLGGPRSRLLLVALVVLPELARVQAPAVPSVPAWLAALREALAGIAP